MAHVELSRRAARDVTALDASTRKRVRKALENLGADADLDVVALTGRSPWRRLRVGDHRVLFRPLSRDELDRLGVTDAAGYLVARIINRRDLHRAVAALDP